MVKTFPLIILIFLYTISWLINISNNKAILRRSNKNPILVADQSNWWEAKAVFNCAILYDKNKNKVHMLYRAIGDYEDYISRIGYASSSDGHTFNRRKEIAFGPSEDYERNGIEDPRLVEIGSKTYITYVVPSSYALGTPIVSSALATTSDYYEFKRLGIITSIGSDNKDVVLFPEKIKSLYREQKTSYFSLQRPSAWIGSAYGVYRPSMWLAEGSLLTKFERYWPLLSPKEDWEILKVGAGVPPIKTKYGWLIIYHGVSHDRIYRVGAALLDLREPIKVIGRTKRPILEPREPYEKYGDVNNVVFPTGACIIDGEVFIYYGGADRVCCLATVELTALIEHILQDSIN
ncbi:MAG: hypothetical protein WAQ29_04420 [Nitrososphaeraceae archaeon]